MRDADETPMRDADELFPRRFQLAQMLQSLASEPLTRRDEMKIKTNIKAGLCPGGCNG